MTSKLVGWQTHACKSAPDLPYKHRLHQQFPMRVFEKASPRDKRHARTVVTGQTGLPVFPTKTSTPEPNWSHLDCFRKKRMTEGLARSSTATWNRKSEIYHKTSHQPIHLTSWDMYTCQTKLIKCLKEVDASYDRVGSSKTGYRVVTTTLDVLSFP